MAIKVEMKKFEDKKIIAIAFEASREDDLELLDILHTALLGDYPIKGGYASSNRIVVHIKTE